METPLIQDPMVQAPEIKLPDQAQAHRIAKGALERISDDVLAQIAEEVGLQVGQMLSQQTIRGALVLALMDAIVTLEAEALRERGVLPVVPVSMQSRARKNMQITILDELAACERFSTFVGANYQFATEKDDAKKQVKVRVTESARLKLPAVPEEQAKELQATLERAGCADPEAALKRVLGIFDATVREEARVLPVSGLVRAQMLAAAERGEEALPAPGEVLQ